MRRRNAIHKPKPLDKVAEIIKSDAKPDLHDRQIGLTEQTRRLLDPQGIDMLGECPSKIIPEKGAEILRRQSKLRCNRRHRERFGEMLTEVADDFLELLRFIVRARAHLMSDKSAVLRAHRHNAEQRGLHGKLSAGRLHLPRAHNLCEQRTDFVLPGFTGANAGAESQPSLGERRQQREFALVGARKLQEIRRKHERAELIFPSGSTNFVQFLTSGEEYIAVGDLVGVV